MSYAVVFPDLDPHAPDGNNAIVHAIHRQKHMAILVAERRSGLVVPLLHKDLRAWRPGVRVLLPHNRSHA